MICPAPPHPSHQRRRRPRRTRTGTPLQRAHLRVPARASEGATAPRSGRLGRARLRPALRPLSQQVGNSNWGFVAAVAAMAALGLAAGALVANRNGGDPAPVVAATADATAGDGHAGDGHADRQVAAGSEVQNAANVPPESDLEALPVASERQVRAEPEMDGDVKVFTLSADPVRWELVDDTWVTAWGYNGQVPGPEIWVEQGDQVRIEFTNNLPEATTIHWHGISVPNEMDGVPGVTQDPIEPGDTFTYEFEAQPSGTFWYHSHFDSTRQLDMGLSGAFVIKGTDEPEYDQDFIQLIDEWIRLPDGRNGWEGVSHAGHNTAEYNWFTLNGKSFPATDEMVIQEGDRVRLRMINAGFQAHPMHLHGERFLVVAKDGAPLPQPYEADTVLVGAGERYDVEIVSDDPGSWLFHCHIPHHLGNDTIEPGGLQTLLTYDGYENAYQREQ